MNNIAGNPYLKVKNGIILFDKIDVNKVLLESETPIMIFLENRIRDNARNFQEVMNSIFDKNEIFYSLKANYLSEICKIISSENIGAEIIGVPELKVAQDTGFKSDKIIVGGPYLSKSLINLAIKNHLREVVIYSLDDLKKIDQVAKAQNETQKVSLRCNSQKYESKLGITLTETTIKKLIKILQDSKNIKITTILSHYGSQMNNPNQYLKNLTAIIKNFKLLRKSGINVKNINLGGGFPEATVMPKPQLEKIGNLIQTKLDESKIEYEKIYFEPGRYLVGDSAVFIAKIVKVTKDRWIFLDLGNNICPKFARCSLRFYNLSRIEAAQKSKTSIAGIIPTDQDVLAKDYFFTENVEVGDKVLITNVGAYCLTFSNRFPYRLPEIFLVNNDKYKLIFNPENDKDFYLS